MHDTAVPKPLTPPDCDLRGMPFMPLDLIRLIDSDFYALSSGDEFKAGVTLWCKAFLRVPAASLPDDDRILAHMSGAGPTWAVVRDMALRGWVKCSDERLYHPVVAEKAREAWAQRLAFRERGRKGNQARWGTPRDPSETEQGSKGDGAGDPSAILQGSQGERGQKRDDRRQVKEESPVASQPPSPLRAKGVRKSSGNAAFDEFWAAYPKHAGGPKATRKAYDKAVKEGASPGELLIAVRRQRWPDDPQYIPYATTWLNQGRWLDDPAAAAPPAPLSNAEKIRRRIAEMDDAFAIIGGRRPGSPTPTPAEFDGPTIDSTAEAFHE